MLDFFPLLSKCMNRLTILLSFSFMLQCRRKQLVYLKHLCFRGRQHYACSSPGLYLGSWSWTLHTIGQLQERDPPRSQAGLQTGRTRFPKQKVINLPVYWSCRSQLLSRTATLKDEPLDNYLRTRSRRHAENTYWNATQDTILRQIFKAMFFRLYWSLPWGVRL